MTTYLVNHLRIPNGILNEEGLTYLERVKATVDPFDGKWLAQSFEFESVEGTWPGAVVLLEFPDMAKAKDWYASPAYQAIVHLRSNNSISDMILVDKAEDGFDPAAVAKSVRATNAAQS